MPAFHFYFLIFFSDPPPPHAAYVPDQGSNPSQSFNLWHNYSNAGPLGPIKQVPPQRQAGSLTLCTTTGIPTCQHFLSLSQSVPSPCRRSDPCYCLPAPRPHWPPSPVQKGEGPGRGSLELPGSTLPRSPVRTCADQPSAHV